MSIGLIKQSSTSVPTPPNGELNVFFDSADDTFKKKLPSGAIVPIENVSAAGAVNYQGTWDASTNSPALASSVGTKGQYRVVNVAGSTNLDGVTAWNVGDWVIFNGTFWEKVDNSESITETSNVFKNPQVVRVKIANAGLGEFTDLSSAVASITDADPATKPYVISMGAGVHSINNPINLPPGVSLKGEGINETILHAQNPTQHLIVMGTFSEVSFCSLYGAVGAIGSGKAGVYAEDAGDFTQVHKVSIYNFDIGTFNYANTLASTMYLEYVDVNGDYSFAVKNVGNGAYPAKLQAENFYTYGSNSVGCKTLYSSGTNSFLVVNSAGLQGLSGNKGVTFDNGADIQLSDIIFSGFDGAGASAIINENTGVGCKFLCKGIGIVPGIGNTFDFKVEHSGTVGSFLGTVEKDKTDIASGASVAFLSLDPQDNGVTLNGKLFYSPTDFNLATDISQIIVKSPTMGNLTGGVLSAGAGLSLNISSGDGYGSLRYIQWASGSLSIPASSSKYIYVDASGVFQHSATLPDMELNILLGRVVTDGSSIIYIENTKMDANHTPNKISKKFRLAMGPLFYTGAICSETGTRQIAMTAGSYFFSENQISLAGGSPITFDAFYQSASPGVFTKIASQTTLSNTQYDDGSGTLASIPSTQYVKHLLISVGGSVDKHLLFFGTSTHSTQAAAEAAPLPSVPSFVTDSFCRISSFVVREGTSSIISVLDERPRIGFSASSSSGGVTDHGALSGLADDDHPQYLLADGTRALTGDLNLGANDIVNAATLNGLEILDHGIQNKIISSSVNVGSNKTWVRGDTEIGTGVIVELGSNSTMLFI